MAEQRPDSFLDIDKMSKEHQLFVAMVVDSMNQVKDLYKTLQSYKAGNASEKELEASLKRSKKATDEVTLAVIEYNKILSQRAVTEAKTAAATSEAAKQNVAAKLSLQQLNQATKEEIQLQQAAEGSIKQKQIVIKQLQREYDNLSASERNAAKGKELLQKIKELDVELKNLEGSTGRYQRNVGNYSGATKVLESALSEVKQKLDDFTKAGTNNTEVIQELQKEQSLLEQILNSSAHGFVSMREDIKQNQVAIEQLALVYGEDSEVVKELIQENGKLRDSFEDLKATQKTVGSDTFVFDGLLKSAEALAGMYGAAQGAAALFGDENEDLQKQMAKLMAVMAVVQGVQATVNALQKEGAAVQLFYSVQTKAVAAAQALATFAMGGATVAAKALRVALLATGLGAVVVLLSAFTSASEEATDSTEDQAKAQEELNQKLADFRSKLTALADQQEKINNAKKGGLDQLKREADLLEANGDKQGAYLKRQLAVDEQIFNLRRRASSFLKSDFATKEEAAAFEADINREIMDLQTEKAVNEVNNNKRIADERQKAIDKGREATEKQAKIDKDLADRQSRAQFEIIQLGKQQQIDALKSIADNEEQSLSTRLLAMKRLGEEQSSLILAQRDFELLNTDLTEKEKQKIKVQASLDLLNLQTEVEKQITAMMKTEQDKRKEKEEKDEADRIEKINKKLQSRLDRNRIAQNQELTLLTESLLAETITVEEYEKQKQAIQEKYLRKNIEGQIKSTEELLKSEKISSEERTRLEAQLSDLRQQYNDIDVEDYKESQKKKTDADKERFDKLVKNLEQVQNFAAQVIDLIGQAITAGIERKTEELNALEEKQQMNYEAEVERISNSSLTEEEKANKLKILESQRMAQKEANERKIRQLNLQRAKFERAENIASIIMETALAVVRALGAKPYTPANIALAAVTGALGAAQLALAIAAPLPKYATGRDGGKAEWALTDELGPELYIERSGRMFMGNDRPTLRYLSEGTKIIPHDKAMAAMSNNFIMEGSRTNVPASDRMIEKKLDQLINITEYSMHETLRRSAKQKTPKVIIHNNGSWNDYVQKQVFN